METFFCKLIPPRASFASDMSPEEAQLMQQHAEYLRGLLARGSVVTFGVVANPSGAFGMAVVEVADQAEVQQLTANDPVIRSERGFRYEVCAMPFGAVHSRSSNA